ncbi:MAG: F0F1 ATP synthase subunit delta [Patescibacteria group bacterium]
MKISVLQYAISLYESVTDKTELEIKDILKNFVVLLGRQHDLNKEAEIIKAFNDLWSSKNGEVIASLVSAHPVTDNTRTLIVNYLKDKSGAQQVILDETEDKNLLGGFVLKYNNKVLDGSLKSGLESLKLQLKG